MHKKTIRALMSLSDCIRTARRSQETDYHAAREQIPWVWIMALIPVHTSLSDPASRALNTLNQRNFRLSILFEEKDLPPDNCKP
jgi:hypothetical protein